METPLNIKQLSLYFLLLSLFFTSLIRAPDPPQRQWVPGVGHIVGHLNMATADETAAIVEVVQNFEAQLQLASIALHRFGSEQDIICFGELPPGRGSDGRYGPQGSPFHRTDFTSLTDLCSYAGNPNGNLLGRCSVPTADPLERRRVIIPELASAFELNDRTLQEHCRLKCICLQDWLGSMRNQPLATMVNTIRNLQDALYQNDIPLDLTERIVELRADGRLNQQQQRFLEFTQDSSQLTSSAPWTDQDSCFAKEMMRERTRPLSRLGRTSYTAGTRMKRKELDFFNGVSMAIPAAGAGRRKMGLRSSLESLG